MLLKYAHGYPLERIIWWVSADCEIPRLGQVSKITAIARVQGTHSFECFSFDTAVRYWQNEWCVIIPFFCVSTWVDCPDVVSTSKANLLPRLMDLR